jgi:hypothetical protein
MIYDLAVHNFNIPANDEHAAQSLALFFFQHRETGFRRSMILVNFKHEVRLSAQGCRLWDL